jgi:glycosyltransferase involved in cell wall biosynthesis
MSVPRGSVGAPRVLHIITGMSIGGAEKVATQLSLAREGDAGIAWLKGPNEWAGELSENSVGLYPIGLKGLLDLPAAAVRLRSVVEEFRPDVVHTHLTHAHVAGRWAARRSGVPVVSTEHNLRARDRLGRRLLYSLDVRTSRQAAAVAAISEAVKRRCGELGFRQETLRVVYNGVKNDPAPPEPLNRRPILAMVGRLHRAKGADIFIRALDLMPDVDGILVGDGAESGLVERLAARLRDPSRLTWLRRGSAANAMATADIVVVPSRSEGLGLVALEAMAYERPVIAARVGGLCEVVDEGATGLLFEPECPAALSHAAAALLKDRGLRRSMGIAGRRRALERFSLEQMLGKYEDIYCSVAK